MARQRLFFLGHDGNRVRGRSAARGQGNRRPLNRWAALRLEPLEDRRMLSAAPSNQQAVQLFDASPALFAKNEGQVADASVRYAFQGSGANVLLTDAGPVFQVFQAPANSAIPSGGSGAASVGTSPANPAGSSATSTPSEQFSVNFLGANAVEPVGLDQAPTVLNYCIGDRSQWHIGVPTYQQVAYDGLYPGIDLVTWGQRESLKYEFHVAPGADWSQIRIHYDGIKGLSVDAQGVLHVHTVLGDLTDAAPFIYQEVGGRQAPVAGRFQLLDADTYTFTISGPYDAGQDLVIDPKLSWSTYLGGSSNDGATGVAADSLGNTLMTGWTSSADFSGANNTYYNGGQFGEDAFVAKVNDEGTLVWVTYLGGSNMDYGTGIAVDSGGNALVTGYTDSTDFVSANNTIDGTPINWDVFVAEVSSGGGVQWATYMGGGSNDQGFAVAVDRAGNALVTGVTNSSNVPFSGADNSYHGGQSYGDAFVAKVSNAGTQTWATYLGGSGYDQGFGIAVNTAGHILVAGTTNSTGFPSTDSSGHGQAVSASAAGR